MPQRKAPTNIADALLGGFVFPRPMGAPAIERRPQDAPRPTGPQLVRDEPDPGNQDR